MFENLFARLDWFAVSLVPSFMALDLAYRARRYETPRWWRLNGMLATALSGLIALEVPQLWAALLGAASVFQFGDLPPGIGAGLGVLVFELVRYAYHRIAHENRWLWRFAHQMHHSAESVDAFGAYFLHPLDAVVFTSLATLVSLNLLGLAIEAALLVNVWVVFNALFQHANIDTPRWLGYLIQRPECHSLHHGRDVHAYNYANLPLIDMLFGTFRNPARHQAPAGFYTGASWRWLDMMAGRDVSRPPDDASTRSRTEILA